MKIIELSPDQMTENSVVDGLTAPKVSPLAVQKPQSSDIGDQLWAGFSRDNTMTGLGRLIEESVSHGGPAEADFNPYGYITKNWDKARQDRLATLIDDDYFDDALNPMAVETYAKFAEEEIERNELAAESGWGTTGSIAGAIIDPINLIPVAGWAAKGRTLYKMAKIGAQAAATQALNETILQAEQDTRTLKESLLNVGVAGVLGGGLGAFSSAALPKSRLHPSHPENPLHPDNIAKMDVEFRAPGESAGDRLVQGDLSAAAVRKAPLVRVGEGTKLGNAIEAITRRITAVTPIGRLKNSPIQAARHALVKLADAGGVLWTINKLGMATGRSAEDLRAFYEVGTREFAARASSAAILDTNQALGQIGAKKIAAHEFMSVMQRFLVNTHAAGDTEELVKQFGKDGAQMVEQRARALSEEVHKINDKVEKLLVERGMVRDDNLLSRTMIEKQGLLEKRKTGLEAIAKKREQLTNNHTADRKGLDADAKAKADATHKDALAALKEEEATLKADTDISHLQATIAEQHSKPRALGRDYGHAQLYDRSMITQNPARFKDMLIEMLAPQVDESWLHENFELTKDMLDGLATSDPEKFRDVMRRWAGDEKYVEITRLEQQLKASQEDLKAAKIDLLDFARSKGLIDRKVVALKTAEARKLRDKLNAELNAIRARRNALKKERKALVRASQAGRQKTLDRQLMHVEDQPDVGAAQLTAAQKAEQKLLGVIERGPDGTELRHGKEKAHRVVPSFDEAALTKAAKNADATRTAATETPLEAPKAPEAPRSVELAEAEGRLAEINAELRKLDRDVADAEVDVGRYTEAHSKVVQKRAWMEKLKGRLDESVSEAADSLRIADKSARKVKAELLRGVKRPGLEEVVDQITEHLTKHGELPSTMMNEIIPESGRVKARRIDYTPEWRRRFEDAGYLRRDVSNILDLQYRQTSGHIALNEALDIGKGKTYGSWRDLEREIETEYQSLMEAHPDHRSAYVAAMQSDIADVQGLKNRLLGLDTMVDDPNSVIGWGMRKLRQANFLRFGSEFLASSLTDIGIASLRHRLIPLVFKHGRRAFVNAIKGLPADQVSLLARASEIAHGHMSLSRRLGDEDLFRTTGIGATGSKMHRVTSTIDVGGQKLTDVVARLSGVPQWNVFWKTLSGYAMVDKISKSVSKFGALTEIERADLASLGIGKAEAERLDYFLKKYGKDDGGVLDANTDDWLQEAGGDDAVKDFMIAIRRDQTRTNLTVGIGDTPLAMDKGVYKALLQFQTFNFVMLNKFIGPLVQRGAHMRDVRAMVSLVTLLSSASLVAYLKAAKRFALDGETNPNDYFFDEKNAPKLAAEILDRSGLMSWTSPVADSLSKLAGLGGVSRYRRNSAVDSLLGPTWGLIRDTWAAGTTATDAVKGDSSLDDVMAKTAVLLPFGNILRMAQKLSTD